MKPTQNNTMPPINTPDILRFLLPSLFGSFMFLIPIPYGDTYAIPLGIVFDLFKAILGSLLPYIVVIISLISAIVSTWIYLSKPKSVLENERLKRAFSTSPLYIISRIIGAVIAVLAVFNFGPEFVTSEFTGGTMVGLCNTLVCIFISISYLLPFITDFGAMEFTGILIRNVVRPLFTVPGRSAIDLVTSWFGTSNTACVLTRRQYDSGFYSAREAAVIMTNFSIVSIPFCLIVATIIGGPERVFAQFYLVTTFTGMVLAVVTPRIPPLSKIPDTYNPNTGKRLDEIVPEGYSKLYWALKLATDRAKTIDLKLIIKMGADMLFDLFFNLIPIVMAWGTIALIIVEYTPLFQWLSYPIGLYLKLLGIEEAFKAAPASLVGFVDMFIPPVMLAGISSFKTKFIIGSVSLLQIIYLTETGAIILQSDISVDFKDLLIIFLERTIIALPIITVIANLMFK